MLLATLDAHFPTASYRADDATENLRLRQSYLAAMRTLQSAGIAIQADGIEAYVAVREQWEPLVRRVAPTLGYAMSEIDRRPPARIVLSVPFAEKEEAKMAGAKWDRQARSWFAEESLSHAVAKWIPDPDRLRAETIIGQDRAAVEQLRTIEAVVSSTLAANPAKAERLLNTGRGVLAARVERGDTVPSPKLQYTGRTLTQTSGQNTRSPLTSPKTKDRTR